MAGRAFILGNGPSLREAPLRLLAGETTFAANRVHLLYDSPAWGDWRPTYYIASDWTGPSMLEDSLVNIECATMSFVRSDRAHEIEMRRRHLDVPPRVTYFWPGCGHVAMDALSTPAGLPSEWHLPTVCAFGSPVSIAAQLATVMGFSELYLLGCDLGHVDFVPGSPDPNHFSPDYVGWSDFPWAQRDATLLHVHRVMESVTRAQGMVVVNLTPTDALDGVHERASLSEVL